MFQASGAELFSMPEADLVSSQIDALTAELHGGLRQAGKNWELLVMDLSSCEIIDVRGIQLIEEAYKVTRDENKKFMLVNVNKNILRYLQLFRLHTKFPIGLNMTSAQLAEERKHHASR